MAEIRDYATMEVRATTNEAHERVSLSLTENDHLRSHQNRNLVTNDNIGRIPLV